VSSTCFGHHYAHLQERKVVYNCTWFSALNVLVGVLGSPETGRLHSVEAVILLSRITASTLCTVLVGVLGGREAGHVHSIEAVILLSRVKASLEAGRQVVCTV